MTILRNGKGCTLFYCLKTSQYDERNNEMRELLTDLIRINDTVDALSDQMFLFPEENPVDPGMAANLLRVKDVIRRLVLPENPPEGLATEKMISAFYWILGSKGDAGEKAGILLQIRKDLMSMGGSMPVDLSEDQNHL